MMKVKCISKNRNNKGNIIDYTLQDETGRVFNVTVQQIKQEMHKGNYEFINLQLDKAGRLIDKQKDEVSRAIEDMGSMLVKVYKIAKSMYGLYRDSSIDLYELQDDFNKTLQCLLTWGKLEANNSDVERIVDEDRGFELPLRAVYGMGFCHYREVIYRLSTVCKADIEFIMDLVLVYTSWESSDADTFIKLGQFYKTYSYLKSKGKKVYLDLTRSENGHDYIIETIDI